jgi:hypothetical protein
MLKLAISIDDEKAREAEQTLLYTLHCTWFEIFANFRETDNVIA